MQMTTEQLETKIAVLEQENAGLRSKLLDSQILSGAIRLGTNEEAGDGE